MTIADAARQVQVTEQSIYRWCKGIQFCDALQLRSGTTARYRLHGFDRVCRQNEIEHR